MSQGTLLETSTPVLTRVTSARPCRSAWDDWPQAWLAPSEKTWRIDPGLQDPPISHKIGKQHKQYKTKACSSSLWKVSELSSYIVCNAFSKNVCDIRHTETLMKRMPNHSKTFHVVATKEDRGKVLAGPLWNGSYFEKIVYCQEGAAIVAFGRYKINAQWTPQSTKKVK